MRRLTTLIMASVILVSAGCGTQDDGDFITAMRMSRGLVMVLPGIEGEGTMSHNIRTGLNDGGIDQAIYIRHWTHKEPAIGMLLNQMDVKGNRQAAAKLAEWIVNHRNIFPNTPIHIVGHSGGGGIAVFIAEELKKLDPDHKIDGLVLLSASISSQYDLTDALSMCKKGIVNFYNPLDIGMLGAGTAVFGNVDGVRGASAGAAMFNAEYPGKLFQQKVDLSMSLQSLSNPHASTTEPALVSKYVAPWLLSENWPPVRRSEPTSQQKKEPSSDEE